jgi:hypothetical protein
LESQSWRPAKNASTRGFSKLKDLWTIERNHKSISIKHFYGLEKVHVEALADFFLRQMCFYGYALNKQGAQFKGTTGFFQDLNYLWMRSKKRWPESSRFRAPREVAAREAKYGHNTLNKIRKYARDCR